MLLHLIIINVTLNRFGKGKLRLQIDLRRVVLISRQPSTIYSILETIRKQVGLSDDTEISMEANPTVRNL